MKFKIGVLSLLFFVSCEEQNELPQSLCDCFDVQMDMMDELEGKELNDEQLAEIEKKYEAEFNACDQLAKDFDDKMKDLSKEEQVEAQKEIMDNCDAYQEYAKQDDQLIQQEMENQEDPFEDMTEEEILEYLEQTAGEELEEQEQN